MNMLILTGYDRNMAELAEMCLPSKLDWAEWWGVKLHVLRDTYPTDFPKEYGHPSYQKLRHIRFWLERYDVVFWMDADSIITNPEIDPRNLALIARESSPAPFVVSGDYKRPSEDHRSFWNQWSAGHAIWFNEPSAFELLDEAITHTEFMWSGLWDQDALQRCLNYRSDPRMPLILPTRSMNSVLPGLTGWDEFDWRPDDFLCHFTGIDREHRLDVARKFIAEHLTA